MVGHHQIGIIHLFKNLECFDEVDIDLVRVELLKIIAVAADVPEVHVEDLIPHTEIPDHVVNFLAGIIQHFWDRTLAEIQPVMRALFDRAEPLQRVRGAQHADQSLNHAECLANRR